MKRSVDGGPLIVNVVYRESTELPNMTRVSTLAAYIDAIRAADQTGKEVVIKLKTRTCQSCLRLEYPLEVIARSQPNTAFIIVDLGDGEGEMARLSENLGVSSVPYFVHYVGGEIRERGSWDSVRMLAAYHSPQDKRRCSVEKKGEVTRERAEKSIQTADGNTTKGKVNTPSGLDILQNAKTIY